ncbi:conjugal transfer protein [Streptomyces sp. NPDC045456]|uniref:conjugal transfer protein n=1 Tax=Streptomyces sp. NPDC045456 TaxID=3155254 RepID=UPI0033D4ACCB
MPSLATIARKVMGLPEPARGQGEEAPASAPQQAKPSNPWESAGATLAAKQRAATSSSIEPSSSPTSSGPRTPWTPQEERSGAVFARRFGRGLLWTVMILAMVTGVRAWIIPPKVDVPPAPKASTGPSYPAAEAQAVAARFSRAYLAWDQAKPQDRAALLAAVMPAGSDTSIGWDGHGRQDVLAVQPGAVTTGSQHQARVRVEALIKPGPPADGKAPDPPARWVGLDVPVVETGGRIVVTGQPGLVGIPTKGPKAPALDTTKTDQELTAETEGVVDRFFRAYAHGDTDAVTAPGKTVPPLPEGIEYKALVTWSIDQGSGTDRTGTARVSWTLGQGAVEQTYRVELTRVSSTDAARWQVADVHGGTL